MLFKNFYDMNAEVLMLHFCYFFLHFVVFCGAQKKIFDLYEKPLFIIIFATNFM